MSKFKSLAQGVVSDSTADKIVATCWKLDRLSDLAELFEFDVIRE